MTKKCFNQYPLIYYFQNNTKLVCGSTPQTAHLRIYVYLTENVCFDILYYTVKLVGMYNTGIFHFRSNKDIIQNLQIIGVYEKSLQFPAIKPNAIFGVRVTCFKWSAKENLQSNTTPRSVTILLRNRTLLFIS